MGGRNTARASNGPRPKRREIRYSKLERAEEDEEAAAAAAPEERLAKPADALARLREFMEGLTSRPPEDGEHDPEEPPRVRPAVAAAELLAFFGSCLLILAVVMGVGLLHPEYVQSVMAAVLPRATSAAPAPPTLPQRAPATPAIAPRRHPSCLRPLPRSQG